MGPLRVAAIAYGAVFISLGSLGLAIRVGGDIAPWLLGGATGLLVPILVYCLLRWWALPDWFR